VQAAASTTSAAAQIVRRIEPAYRPLPGADVGCPR
jgi:hypothetical protein